MLRSLLSDDPWFEPKRFGYGAGWPIAWQGWALLAAFLVPALGFGLMLERGQYVVGGLCLAIATGLLLLLAKRHTRGGWRWRG